MKMPLLTRIILKKEKIQANDSVFKNKFFYRRAAVSEKKNNTKIVITIEPSIIYVEIFVYIVILIGNLTSFDHPLWRSID